MASKRFLPALLLAVVGGFMATLALTGAVSLPWEASSTQARTIALEGGSFGPVAEPPAIPLPGGATPLVSFQGRLTNPSTGLPVPNGSYSTTFSIFEAPTGGTAAWTETQSVSVSGGLFSVYLGSVTPLDASVFSNTNRYLETQVSPDPPLIPRLQFGYVPYAFQAEQAGAVSRPGFSLTALDGSAEDVGDWTSATIGADGLPVISYHDVTNDNLKVAHCGNPACTAGNTITTVEGADVKGHFSSITIGGDGLPVISYYDGTNLALKVAHCGNAACSAGNTFASVDSNGAVPFGYYTSITTGADGLPIISYRVQGLVELRVAHCGNASCSAGNTVTILDTVGNVGEYTSITIGGDGLPIISYLDFSNFDLKVAHCGNIACTTACGVGGTTCTAVDGGADVGFYTSVTVGTDGLPLISYHDNTTDDLKVAHCGDVACTTACGVGGTTCTAVDTTGNVADWTSVTVGADGLPFISYHDLAGDLKVAHCANAACTTVCGVGGTTCTTIDSAGFVGTTTSVALGADGLPLISYYDVTNGNLKAAHCSNRFCLPNHRPR
jgi:hypothetical protein